jgi:hypothetical protein
VTIGVVETKQSTERPYIENTLSALTDRAYRELWREFDAGTQALLLPIALALADTPRLAAFKPLQLQLMSLFIDDGGGVVVVTKLLPVNWSNGVLQRWADPRVLGAITALLNLRELFLPLHIMDEVTELKVTTAAVFGRAFLESLPPVTTLHLLGMWRNVKDIPACVMPSVRVLTLVAFKHKKVESAEIVPITYEELVHFLTCFPNLKRLSLRFSCLERPLHE